MNRFLIGPPRSPVFKLMISFTALSMLYIGLGCSIRNPQAVTDGQPELKDFVASEAIHLLSDSLLVVSVRVDDPQEIGDIASVQWVIVPDGSTLPAWSGAMEDDGSAGDLIAHDGVFSARLDSARLVLQPGTVRIGVAATDISGLESDTLWAASVVTNDRRNSPPVLTGDIVPNTLIENQTSQVFLTAFAEDPDGLNDIDSVWAEAYPPLAVAPYFTIRLNGTAVQGIFNAEITPVTFFPNRPVLLKYDIPDIVPRTNSSPIVLAVQVPDTAILPSSVYFKTTKPDGTQSGSFQMYDDGNLTLHGDQTAGDRIYSLVITITSSNQLGDYLFDFYADTGTDQSGAWLFRFMAADRGGLKSLPVVRGMNVERNTAPEPALSHRITVKDGNESL
jgi:hypothetical protein